MAHHQWEAPARSGDVLVWECKRCPIVVTTKPDTAFPAKATPGRTVNGSSVSRHYVLPSCKTFPTKKPKARAEPSIREFERREELREHELEACYTALGREWVLETIGPRRLYSDGSLDLDWEIGLLQLYHAVRVMDLEAVDVIPLVKERIRERSRLTANHLAVATVRTDK